MVISSRLVDLMDEEIWLESTPGEGTTFHFTVRLGRGEGTAPALEMPAQLEGTRVLVLEDNATNRHLVTRLLEPWGMVPVVVKGGEEALKKMKEEEEEEGRPCPLVLLDEQMPRMSGLETADRMREEGAGEEATADQQSERGGRLRVLLVEDNNVNQKFAKHLLEREGNEVGLAENGVEALEAFEEGTYDLVLMDVQMPEMGGLEATRRIRSVEEEASAERTPIVALTARATEEDRERCLEAGMDDYLSKPMEGEELEEVLDQLSMTPSSEENSLFLGSPDDGVVDLYSRACRPKRTFSSPGRQSMRRHRMRSPSRSPCESAKPAGTSTTNCAGSPER